VYRYVGSPSNPPPTGAVDCARGLVEPDPITPQTGAALSLRLLEILQHREPTHKRALNDTTSPNDDRRSVINNLPERPASTVGYLVARQSTADGIMQWLGATEQGRNGPSPTRSETLDIVETDVSWSTSSTIPHHEDLNRVPKSRESMDHVVSDSDNSRGGRSVRNVRSDASPGKTDPQHGPPG